ncbi:3'-5' exonuclease [Microbacterium sp. NPDC056569]|uniref:3'-5' exonuclease n=1 Tax=Microbacterium sp. NPDC056569 TaxID=3345867 RepID=UPI00366C1140
MPNVVWTNLKGPDHDRRVRAKIYSFLDKLRADDTSSGLHIEKMQGAADPRARTGRVDQGLRAVLYRLDSAGERTYVYIGTFEHDKGSEYARTRVLDYNPVNGIAELITASVPDVAPHLVQSATAPVAPSEDVPTSFLEGRGYLRSGLVDELGFDDVAADLLFSAADAEAVLAIGESFENAWQRSAALGLAVGDSVEKIREDLAITELPDESADESSDDRILRALQHPSSKMQFTFVEDDDALRAVIEGGDFDAWRVFLHPEQQKYATGDWGGPFRLSGGAGTGKTVVLLHRAKHLARLEPSSSIVLTTYTRALAENMKRDLDRLDSEIPKSDRLGEPGVHVRGLDQLVTAVRARAGRTFGAAAVAVFGEVRDRIIDTIGNLEGWATAITAAKPDLPAEVATPAFFEAEYLQVVLPVRITMQDEYLEVRRLGRRTALDAAKRAEVWRVIEAYREHSRTAGTITWAEQAAIAAAWLDTYGAQAGALVDHLLVDEGQDLTPAHWQFVRALVRVARNDLFVAEDTHQRIYGPSIVLARYGIRIVGRSRRMTLNYRTTAENLRYAVSVLDGGEYIDGESVEEGSAGYRSARRGPRPETFEAQTSAEHLEFVARRIDSWVEAGVDPATIAVLTRTNELTTFVRDGLAAHGVAVNVIKSAQRGGDRPVALTMHTSKGMEFSRVILFDISEGAVPLGGSAVLGDDEREDALLRERSLLYVAASRARDVLVVTWCGRPSHLLAVSETGS